jgi:hypothetical protein
MGATTETQLPVEIDWSPGPGAFAPGCAGEETDIHRLAETFAVTPEAVRLAVERVGPGFRELQRELGGRR